MFIHLFFTLLNNKPVNHVNNPWLSLNEELSWYVSVFFHFGNQNQISYLSCFLAYKMNLHSIEFILRNLSFLLAYGIRTLKYDEVSVELICIFSVRSTCCHAIVRYGVLQVRLFCKRKIRVFI